MKVTAKFVELQMTSVHSEKYPNPEIQTEGDIVVYLDEQSPFVEAMKMLFVNAIYRGVQEKFIGDSLWKLVCIEGIEVSIDGRVYGNTLRLP